MFVAFVLLAVAVIVLNAPAGGTAWSWGNWVSLVLAILALLVAVFRHSGAAW